MHIHTHNHGARERIGEATSRILSTTQRKRKRLLQQRINPEQIEFAHFFEQDLDQNNGRRDENTVEDHFSIGESVDHIQNISSRILVKAGERRLVLLRRLKVLPISRSSEEITESGPGLNIVQGSSGKKGLTSAGILRSRQPDREIQV